MDNGRIVVYKIHKESGLGNMIRGYLTAFVVAILTNRGVQGRHASQPSPTVKAPREFFFKFFTPPFPNMSGRNSGNPSSSRSRVVATLKGNFSTWDYFPKQGTIQRLKSEHLAHWWNTSGVVITTYSDVTARFLSPALYAGAMRAIGVLPRRVPHPRTASWARRFAVRCCRC